MPTEVLTLRPDVDLRQMIADQGLDQQQFAAKAGISPTLLSFLINGRRGCSLRIARQVTAAAQPDPVLALFSMPAQSGSARPVSGAARQGAV